MCQKLFTSTCVFCCYSYKMEGYEPVKDSEGNYVIDEGKLLVRQLSTESYFLIIITENVKKIFNMDLDMDKPNKENVDKDKNNNPNNNNKWTRNATLALVDQYKSNMEKFKSTTVRNEKVWGDISQLLNSYGLGFSAKQCEFKWKNLRKKYINKKDNMKTSGAAVVEFEYFTELDEIYGNKPIVQPVSVASSSRITNTSMCNTEDGDQTLIKETFQPQMKKRKTSHERRTDVLMTNLWKMHEKKEEAREKRHKELLEKQERALKSYENMMGKLLEKL